MSQIVDNIEIWYMYTAALKYMYYHVCPNTDPRLTFYLFYKGQLWFPIHLYGKCLNGGLLKTIEICDIKVSINEPAHEIMVRII